MSEEELERPKSESDILDSLIKLERAALELIAKDEEESAPVLTAEEAKDQLATYDGTSDHASFVEQLGEKEIERDQYKEDYEKLKFDDRQQRFNERYDLHELRCKYIPYLFWMVVGWLILVASVVIAAAFGISYLSDPVLIALITTTTATVVGMFVIAARWLFPPRTKK